MSGIYEHLRTLARQWRASGHGQQADDIEAVLALFDPPASPAGVKACKSLVLKGAQFEKCNRPATDQSGLCEACLGVAR